MTSTPLGLRGDRAAIIAATAGVAKEILVDTTNWRPSLHDGATLGGRPIALIGDVAGRNIVDNGNFAVNQRVYASGSTLPRSGFAHDRWCDGTDVNGSSGYSFTQAARDTMINITAGSIQQTIEGVNFAGGPYILSWVGSVTMLIFYKTPGASSYALYTSASTSPIAVNGIPSGSTILLRTATTGTLGQVQFAQGTIAMPFEGRSFGIELARCQRYYEKSYPQGVAPGTASSFTGTAAGIAVSNAPSASYAYAVNAPFKVTKRAAPTIVLYSPYSGAVGTAYDNTAGKDVQGLAFSPGDHSFQWYAQVYAATGNVNLSSHYTASADI